MKITVIEGTPEELKAIVPSLFTDDIIVNKESGNETIIHPKDAYRALLTRRGTDQGQLDMYSVLSKGELEYNEYLKQMDRSPQQIAGVHGAFGKRVNGTKEIHEAGLPGNMSAVVQIRKEKGKVYISLKPEFVEVLIEEKII